jgi:sensor histidine kinase regulating citrate/malate metabolism
MKNYVADELSNKVFHLSKALSQAEKIIEILEQENKNLRDALNSLASKNKEDYLEYQEDYSVSC